MKHNETDPYPFILVCVYHSQSLTHDKNQEIIKQITKIIIKDNHELVVVGTYQMFHGIVVLLTTGTANKSYILQKNSLTCLIIKT